MKEKQNTQQSHPLADRRSWIAGAEAMKTKSKAKPKQAARPTEHEREKSVIQGTSIVYALGSDSSFGHFQQMGAYMWTEKTGGHLFFARLILETRLLCIYKKLGVMSYENWE